MVGAERGVEEKRKKNSKTAQKQAVYIPVLPIDVQKALLYTYI
jgi:hypothetical protein